MGDGASYVSKRSIAVAVFTFVCIVSLNIYIGGDGPVGQLDSESEGTGTSIKGSSSAQSENENEKPQKVKAKKKAKVEKIVDSEQQLVECPQKEDRWSNRPFPTSSVQSMFNCDRDDSMCNYYYSANFFDKECGLGKEFAHHIDDAQAMKMNGTLWNFMPSVGFPTLTMNNTCLHLDKNSFALQGNFLNTGKKVSTHMALKDIGYHETDTQRCYTERLSFLHVHKAGGSSLHNAFNFMSSSKNAALVRHKHFDPSSTPGVPKEITITSEGMTTFTLESLATASKYPDEEFAREQHVIFAAVRDPTERFISSIGQALGANGSTGNRIAPTLKKACIKETSAETLKCLAHYVQDNGFWIELHFTPQVIDIAFTTMWKDVPIAMFSFSNLKDILKHFGRENVHVRDGSNDRYRADPILTNMTVADYDQESLRIVCEIYEMDVRMQRSLGYEVPRCDPYISRAYNFAN